MPTEEAASHTSPGRGEDGQTLVQVIGRIGAGRLTTAMDLAEEYVHLPPGIADTHERFALQVPWAVRPALG